MKYFVFGGLIFFIFIKPSFAQTEKDFKKIWSFHYLSNLSNSIQEYSFFIDFKSSHDTVYSNYFFSSTENEKDITKRFLQHLFQPKCLSDFFNQFKSINVIIFKLVKITDEYDKFGNLILTRKQIVKTYSIGRGLAEKLNWDFIKDKFFISSKGSELGSLLFRIALDLNSSKSKEFNKFIKNLAIVQ